MKKLTIINDAKLLELQRKSDLDIYKDDMQTVIEKFNARHPDKKGLNVLAMRSVLAGDTEIIRHKTRKFFLVLTSELDIFDEINNEIKSHDRTVRAENKVIKADAYNRLMQDPTYKAMMQDIAKIMQHIK